MELVAEGLDDLVAFALAHEAVVDEHAGELVADRFVDEHGCDGGVDATGEAADDLLVADLFADLADLFFDDVGGGPGERELADVGEEPAEHLLAVRGV